MSAGAPAPHVPGAKHLSTMWLIVNQVSGSSLPCLFTASLTRAGAWDKFEALYRERPEESARVARDRKSGVLRAVKAEIAWRLP